MTDVILVATIISFFVGGQRILIFVEISIENYKLDNICILNIG